MSAFSFRDWYARNGETLNEKRRDRYNRDAEYRKKVLQTNQESRERCKADPSTPKPRPRVKNDSKIEVNGDLVRVYTITEVAAQLGCSVQSLRVWEDKGFIPSAPYRSGNRAKGARLYTEEFIVKIRKLLLAQGRLVENP